MKKDLKCVNLGINRIIEFNGFGKFFFFFKWFLYIVDG